MTEPLDPFAELRLLLHESQATGLNAEQEARLQSLLATDLDARRFYIEMMFLYGQLQFERGFAAPIDSTSRNAVVSVEPLFPSLNDAIVPHPSLIGGTFFSYLIAALIVGLGLTIAGNWHIADFATQEIAGKASPSKQPPVIVAQITSMHDCVWQKKTQPNSPRPEKEFKSGVQDQPANNLVALGDEFSLSSGLLVLTYHSGAKVVLEGPVTFAVDSASGGHLSSGKLLARINKNDSRQQSTAMSGIAPLFAITTPTATITDLGTEFGVDVHASGFVDVHVFSGTVECTAPAKEHNPALSLRLTQDMAASIDAEDNSMRRMQADRRRFAKMPKPEPLPLACFFPFDGNADDAGNNPIASPHTNAISFCDGYEGQAAHFDAHGGSFIDLPIDARPTAMPRMTWGAWVRPHTLGPHRNEILSTDISGYGRTLTIDERGSMDNIPPLRFATFLGDAGIDRGVFCSNGPRPQPDRWTFVAGTFDDKQHRVDLFVEDPTLNNGIGGLVHDRTIGAQYGPANPFVRIGRHASMGEAFDGAIDNVFIFREMLTKNQLESIRRHGSKAIMALANGEDAPD